MNGPMAQIVALTCHGNAFLRGQDVGTFYPDNPTFAFCDRVSFATVNKMFFGGIREHVVAKNPNAWFSQLAAAGAKELRLSLAARSGPDTTSRMSDGFDSGGTWTIEVRLPGSRSEYWAARWHVWKKDAPDQRIWRVLYGRTSSGNTLVMRTPPLDSARSRLTKSTQDMLAFASNHQCGDFAQVFRDALDMLDANGKKVAVYHTDLAPQGLLSAEAGTMLAACQKAWVFGGMGSWNDLVFEGEAQQTYLHLSGQHFRIVNEAISAATNSACGP